MNPFELFSMCDLLGPLWYTAKGIHFTLTDGEPIQTIWLDKGELSQADRVLGKNGIKVVSKTMMAFDGEAGLDVKQGQLNEALDVLAANGIFTW